MATIVGSRSGLYWRTIPGGLPSIVDVTKVAGNLFFVDSNASGAGDTTGHGYHPDKPFSTLDYAVGRCTANQGDTIIVLPGHVETVIAAAGLDLDVAGITIVFAGYGNARGYVTFTTDVGADMDVDAADITMINPRFVAGINALTGPIDINAARFTMIGGGPGCRVTCQDGTTINTTDWVVADANADDLLIEDFEFIDGDAGGLQKQSCIQIAAATRPVLRRIRITGDFGTGVIENGTAWVDALLEDCVLENTNAGPVVGILLQATSSGSARKVDVRVASGVVYVTADNDMQWFDCWGVGADAAAGDTIGTVPAASIEGKIDTIDGYHDAPTADVVTNAQMRDVIGNKTDAAVNAKAATKSIIAYLKGVLDELAVPGADNTDNAFVNDVIGQKTDAAASGAVTATDTLVAYIKQLVTELAVVDEYHDVPAADNVLNAQINEVIGNKTDAAASGAVTGTDTLVAYIKQLVTELAVVDEYHDVPAADNVLNAQINEVIGNKTDAAASGAVTGTDTLVAYIKQLVTELAVVDEYHDVPAADNVLNAQMNEVLGNKTDAAAAGAVTGTDTVVAYIKQIVTDLLNVDSATTDSLNGKLGTDTELADRSVYDLINGGGPAAAAAAAAPANDVSVYGVLRELYNQAEKAISTAAAVLANGDTTVFTIAGGPIEVLGLLSVCVTLNDATASTLQYQADPTAGGVTALSLASASLANAAAGTSVLCTGTFGAAPTVTTDGTVAAGTTKFIVPAGIIKITVGTGPSTGTWTHHLRYRPLARGVTVS